MTQPILKPGAQADLSIFDDIRAGFRFVHDRAVNVRIDPDRLAAYAATLPDRPPHNVLDSTHHFMGGAEETAAYIIVLDGINFGSGYQPHLEREGWQTVDGSLYFTLSTQLKKYFETHGALTGTMLLNLTAADMAAMLALDITQPYSAEFSTLCAQSLHEIGACLEADWHGSFLNFVDGAGGAAAVLVERLGQLHGFHDVHSYQDRKISFFKRAQITAADLQIAFGRLGRVLFSDIGQLTMFPDNAVPHVLRTDGVLVYSAALAAHIDAGLDIPSGSVDDVEIRACAGHAVELLAAAKGMRAMDLDHILWHRSAEDPRYTETLPHRTLSRFY